MLSKKGVTTKQEDFIVYVIFKITAQKNTLNT